MLSAAGGDGAAGWTGAAGGTRSWAASGTRACVYWTGARWASGEDYAPRPNTPRAVLVADLPPPLAPEVPATAEPNEA